MYKPNYDLLHCWVRRIQENSKLKISLIINPNLNRKMHNSWGFSLRGTFSMYLTEIFELFTFLVYKTHCSIIYSWIPSVSYFLFLTRHHFNILHHIGDSTASLFPFCAIQRFTIVWPIRKKYFEFLQMLRLLSNDNIHIYRNASTWKNSIMKTNLSNFMIWKSDRHNFCFTCWFIWVLIYFYLTASF